MEQKSFCNKSKCTKSINKLSAYLDEGLSDLETCSEKIIVNKDDLQNAIDQFEIAREKGGRFFNEIIKYPFFTQREIEVILQYI